MWGGVLPHASSCKCITEKKPAKETIVSPPTTHTVLIPEKKPTKVRILKANAIVTLVRTVRSGRCILKLIHSPLDDDDQNTEHSATYISDIQLKPLRFYLQLVQTYKHTYRHVDLKIECQLRSTS